MRLEDTFDNLFSQVRLEPFVRENSLQIILIDINHFLADFLIYEDFLVFNFKFKQFLKFHIVIRIILY